MHVRNSDDGSIEISGFPSREKASVDDGGSRKRAARALGPEKSDNLIVPGKRPNKRRLSAEAAEGRGLPKENMTLSILCRTRSRVFERLGIRPWSEITVERLCTSRVVEV
jgi:hypothetical protein